nr:MAG TPA: Neurotoxin BmK X/BETA scaffold, TOXIN [Caudoviricetes sp.]
MTEKEIVQALRCCTDHSCSAKCPAYQAGLDCREEMHKAVLNLVESLTAENAGLRTASTAPTTASRTALWYA